MTSRLDQNKYACFLILLSVLVGCKNNTNEVFTNEPDGFRDYKWGTKLDNIEGMKRSDPIAKKFDLPNFEAVKDNEILNIYGTKSSTITYLFKDDLLASVVISLPSKESFNKVKEYFFNVYGTRVSSTRPKDNEEYLWKGKKTEIKLSNVSNQKSIYGYIVFKSLALNKAPTIELGDNKLPAELTIMQFSIEMNKSMECGLMLLTDNYLPSEYENYDIYLCKLYDLSDKGTKNVFEEILRSGIVKPDYYYFSVFLENYDLEESNIESLYEESEIGLFPNFDKCNQVANFAMSHNIPIRQCRSWKSHTDYMNKLHEQFSGHDLE